MEMPGGVAPYKPLLHIRGQCDIVREIEISLQGQHTAIDEGIAVVDCRAVGKDVLAPVYSLIPSDFPLGILMFS